MSYNSISQKFTPATSLQCAAVELFFVEAGGDVIVSLGELDESGLPGLAWVQKRVAQAEIQTGGVATRVVWDAPALLAANTAYAITVSAADTVTSLMVGQVGEQSQGGGWVTAAQAAIGELISVNPSGIATSYSTRMLQFDLLAVSYTEQQRTVVVGAQAVVNATALMVNAGAAQPEGGARITYRLDLLDGVGDVVQGFGVDTGQIVQLSAPHTGSVRLSATLRVGESGLGAVLEPGTVLVVGSLLAEGTYITPSINTASGNDASVIFEADVPGGAAVAVHAQLDGAAAWVPVPWETSSAQTAGVIEIHHRLPAFDADAIRLRLTLSGNTAARPKVRNLRAAIL